jgi:hypothetical protein
MASTCSSEGTELIIDDDELAAQMNRETGTLYVASADRMQVYACWRGTRELIWTKPSGVVA